MNSKRFLHVVSAHAGTRRTQLPHLSLPRDAVPTVTPDGAVALPLAELYMVRWIIYDIWRGSDQIWLDIFFG